MGRVRAVVIVSVGSGTGCCWGICGDGRSPRSRFVGTGWIDVVGHQQQTLAGYRGVAGRRGDRRIAFYTVGGGGDIPRFQPAGRGYIN